MGLGACGNDVMADEFLAGHVSGVGMIAACVSTVAASSRHFLAHSQKCSGEQERWNAGTGLFFINR
ncbi:DUF2776 family protein [Escherichia coli]